MSVYTDVKKINGELDSLTSELRQLRIDLCNASKYAAGQYNSDVAAGFFSQIGFAAQAGFAEESRLETLVSEKELELKIKKEELKSRLHFYFRDMLISAQYNSLTLASYLDKYSMVSQWDEVVQICTDSFGIGTFWELCRK